MWNQLKTIGLLGVLTALLIGVGGWLAPGQLTTFVVLALVLNLGAWFFSDRLVLALHHAREVGFDEAPGLHRIVEDLARRAGIPKPRVCLIPEAQPNAFATGRGPDHAVVAATSGLLDMLDEREIRAVIAHEIGHIVNRDVLIASVAAAMAGAVSWVAHALSWASLFGHGPGDEDNEAGAAGGLLVALVAPFLALVVQMAVSRAREFAADETGADLSGEPRALASALRRLHYAAGIVPSHAEPGTASLWIVNPLHAEHSLVSLFSTHPPVAERIDRLLALAAGRPPERRLWRGRRQRLA